MLFYDPILSADHSISCASCHSPYQAFAHNDHELSHGINDRIGKRNAPALFNLAWQKTFMWDGAIHHIDFQPLAPINHPDEMGEHTAHVIEKLNKLPAYISQCNQAFGDDTLTGERMLKSLSQFQLSLVSADSKYDRVKKGSDHFSPMESAGYSVYRSHCSSCHPEPLFFKNEFTTNGLSPDSTLNDSGRYTVTRRPEDLFLFKIPSLRNLSYSYPYMHDGRFQKISDVIRHYSEGIDKTRHLPKSIKGEMHLEARQKTELTAFLLTLNDSAFIFRQNHQYPRYLFQGNRKVK